MTKVVVVVEEDEGVVDLMQITMTMDVTDMLTTFLLPTLTPSYLNSVPCYTFPIMIPGPKKPMGQQLSMALELCFQMTPSPLCLPLLLLLLLSLHPLAQLSVACSLLHVAMHHRIIPPTMGRSTSMDIFMLLLVALLTQLFNSLQDVDMVPLLTGRGGGGGGGGGNWSCWKQCTHPGNRPHCQSGCHWHHRWDLESAPLFNEPLL